MGVAKEAYIEALEEEAKRELHQRHVYNLLSHIHVTERELAQFRRTGPYLRRPDEKFTNNAGTAYPSPGKKHRLPGATGRG